MSAWFKVPPVTQAQVQSLVNSGMSSIAATKTAKADNLESAIHMVKDLEDAKVCMLALLNMWRHR